MIVLPCSEFGALHPSAAGVEVAHHVAHVRIGNSDAHAHDRLEQHRAGILYRQLEGFPAGDFKGDRLGVDFVFLAVIDDHFDVAHRVAGEGALFHGGLMPFSIGGR